ncbi:YqaJ viral recombinase family nuclease [Zhihengliuella halotolerans]|uniref:YqaJ viral recombinase family nuclease n=1 Tax=Zhihengliuella halotolerans TaxID=370736 RepID=UPI0015E0C945|nr:YqaJ viral recombinase family protein [Zhihengliuella halotolerans]
MTTTITTDFRTPNAKLVLRANAVQEDWLEARKQGIGGSDVSALVGLNKYSSAYDVWATKLGYAEDKRTTQAMRMGHLLEPVIRTLFTEDTGIRVRAAGLMRSKTHPFMQVTVDGLTPDGGIFEAKSSTGWLSSDWADDQVPDHAELQVQHGMAVTGRSHAWVCGLLDGRDFFVRRVERDDALIETLTRLESDFWNHHVLTGQPPAVTDVSLDGLKRDFAQATDTPALQPRAHVLELRERLADAKARIKDAEKDKAQVEAEFRMLFGEHNVLKDSADGETTLATLNQNGTFAASRFQEAEPELWAELQVDKPTLDVDRLKTEFPETYTKYRARVLRTPAIKEGK